MSTEQVIARMLKENTGQHFLDSGGAYGRNWERNQIREFENEPESYLEVEGGLHGGDTWINYTHNLYHWLKERLEYDEKADTAFYDWCKETDPDNDKYWLQLMEEFPKYLKSKGAFIGGIYGEGKPFTVNTYNHDSLLSQTIQYMYFTVENNEREDCESILEDGVYVLLQIHGGCDARGGYTAPKLFCLEYDEVSILRDQDANICCNGDGHNWYTDDGYHWYDDGCCGSDHINLEHYHAKKVEGAPWIIRHIIQSNKPTIDKRWLKKTIWIDDDNIPHCPICGTELNA